MDDLKFIGNQDDLKAFRALVRSSLRSQEREDALQAWQKYKLDKQLAAQAKQRRRRQDRLEIVTKGDYIKSLTVRAIDLRGAFLDGICLGYADLRGVIFDGASMRGAWLKRANLENASLRHVDLQLLDPSKIPAKQRKQLEAEDRARYANARLIGADLTGADLEGAKLNEADLSASTLRATNLTNAELRNVNFSEAVMVGTKLTGADLSGSRVYGVASWDVETGGDKSLQRDLIVSESDSVPLKVNDLDAAQFVFAISDNDNIPEIIDSVADLTVLILGRFYQERKRVLDAVRSKLKDLGHLPIIFDFDKPESRNLTETVSALAHLSRFVIADITDAKSIPQELQRIIPSLPSVPIQPIIHSSFFEYSMFKDLLQYPWVLMPYRYESETALVESLESKVISPLVEMAAKIEDRKRHVAAELGPG